MLPLKEILTGKQAVCVTDLDEVKEESNKKEKAKELLSFSNIYSIVKDSYSSTHHYISFTIPLLLQNIDTPPPDVV